MLPATEDRFEVLLGIRERAEEFFRRGSDRFFLYPPGGNVATDCDLNGLIHEVEDIRRQLEGLTKDIWARPLQL
jgi:hypothetical protein